MRQVWTFRMLLVLVALLLAVVNGYAQRAGELDLSFNPNDKGFGAGDGPNATVRGVHVLPNGKIYVWGDFNRYNGAQCRGFIRLHPDGTVDATFQPDTTIKGVIYVLAVLPDGRSIIRITQYQQHAAPKYFVARLLADGPIDKGFELLDRDIFIPLKILWQRDDSYFIISGLGTYDPPGGRSPSTYITSVSPNGIVSDLIRISGYANNSLSHGDGRLILQGRDQIYQIGDTGTSFVIRLNINGTSDTAYKRNLTHHNISNLLAIQSNGRVLCEAATGKSGTQTKRLIRLCEDGTLDFTFNTASSLPAGSFTYINGTALQPDGKVLVAFFSKRNGVAKNTLMRLNSNGTRDVTFTPIETHSSGLLTSDKLVLAAQPDGYIIIGGELKSINNKQNWTYEWMGKGLVRFDKSGSFDKNFNPSSGANGEVTAMVIQPDGKIILCGYFTAINGTPTTHIARLHVNGTLDLSFDPGSGILREHDAPNVEKIMFQKDGKILVSGEFTSYNKVPCNGLIRLHPNGNLDATFLKNIGSKSWLQLIGLQTDEKIIVRGSTERPEVGKPSKQLTRLQRDGRLDTTYNPDQEIRNQHSGRYYLSAASLLPDGKVLIAVNYADQPQDNFVYRVNADGTLDTMQAVVEKCSVRSIQARADGVIYIIGSFTYGNNLGVIRMITLNADGTPNALFIPEIAELKSPWKVIFQPDGKTLVLNHWCIFNEGCTTTLIRFNADGSADQEFNALTSTIRNGLSHPRVDAIVIQPDGNILIAGSFTSYNGIGRNRIARIFGK